MMPRRVLLTIMLLLTACNSETLVSEQERQTQNAADTTVAHLLFEQGLSETASYNVHGDGLVVIKFDRSVTEPVYRDIVERLRADPAIDAVRAEQAGKEICPLRR